MSLFPQVTDSYQLINHSTEAIRTEVLTRLQALNLTTLRLPIGTPPTSPHIPILISNSLATKSRVIILFYEHTQDLGIFAYRIIGGRGGINAGSAVDMVRYIQSLTSSPSAAHDDSPGIILANLGQLRWHRRGSKAVTQTSWFALPRASSVGSPFRFDQQKNTVDGNRSGDEHVKYIFNHVVKELCRPDAIIDVIGVSDGGWRVLRFLDEPENWGAWNRRMGAAAIVAPVHQEEELENMAFRGWFAKVCGACFSSWWIGGPCSCCGCLFSR